MWWDAAALRRCACTNTPLVPVTVRLRGRSQCLWLKLEQSNPTGSVKYRTALGLLASLVAERPLVPGTVVVESTSGNLGVALAEILQSVGCTFVAVVDPKLTSANRAAMSRCGAQLVEVDREGGRGTSLQHRLVVVGDLLRADPSRRWTDQYSNPANPGVHRAVTARELVRETAGSIDGLFTAVSTGGTLAGLVDGLRAHVPHVAVFAVDVHGSVVTTPTESTPHLLNGIGASRRSDFLARHHYDEALIVRDVEAFAFCRMLLDDAGLGVGGSAGAVIAAFCRVLIERGPGWRLPVALVPDGAAGYLETLYNDEWLRQRGVLDAVHDVVRRRRADGLRFEVEGVLPETPEQAGGEGTR